MATKVTMLRNPSSAYGCDLKEGETGFIDDALASDFVSKSIAIIVEPPKVIQAVPAAPVIAGSDTETPPVDQGEKGDQPRRGRR